MSTATVRVSDGDGRAFGEWAGGIGDDIFVKGPKDMVRMRVLGDRMLVLRCQGKTSLRMKCAGEEAVAVAQRAAQREGDINFPVHRQQGLPRRRRPPAEGTWCARSSRTHGTPSEDTRCRSGALGSRPRVPHRLGKPGEFAPASPTRWPSTRSTWTWPPGPGLETPGSADRATGRLHPGVRPPIVVRDRGAHRPSHRGA